MEAEMLSVTEAQIVTHEGQKKKKNLNRLGRIQSNMPEG